MPKRSVPIPNEPDFPVLTDDEIGNLERTVFATEDILAMLERNIRRREPVASWMEVNGQRAPWFDEEVARRRGDEASLLREVQDGYEKAIRRRIETAKTILPRYRAEVLSDAVAMLLTRLREDTYLADFERISADPVYRDKAQRQAQTENRLTAEFFSLLRTPIKRGAPKKNDDLILFEWTEKRKEHLKQRNVRAFAVKAREEAMLRFDIQSEESFTRRMKEGRRLAGKKLARKK